MQINIYKDQIQKARLFGASVLYSERLIPREDVPLGWYCYDLRGTMKEPNVPYALADSIKEENRLASILSYLPLKCGKAKIRLISDKLQPAEESITLAKFCEAEHIPCPETSIRYRLRPASPEEAGLFYALPPERDAAGTPAGAQRSGPGGERKRWRK